MSSRPEVRTTGNLRPLELATGAVMAGFTVALSVIATVIPLASALHFVAAVPMGIVAQRFRLRAVVASGISATVVAFVAAGSGSASAVALCVLIGGIIGNVKRRGRGFFSALLASFVVGPLVALYSIVLLLILSPLRNLILDSLDYTARGVAAILKRWPPLIGAAEWIENSVGTIVDYWWVWIAATATLGIVFTTVVSYFVLGAVLDRLAAIPTEDQLESALDTRPIGPLPLALEHVGFTYSGAHSASLTDINFTIARGEFIAIVGHNGSGKSTLTRLLAGRAPSTGIVVRPGAAGLGRTGGTAVVLQRPESQILGTRVADDVVWGLQPDHLPDIEALLTEVGLGGMAMRETSSLSGGEMQRLAVAAALARKPALLIADEATAMVDRAGREELVELLATLPRRHDMTVVLVTHHQADTRRADRVIQLQGGRQIEHQPHWMLGAGPTTPSAPWPRSTRPLLEINNVSHTYNHRTPWSRTALSDVNLTIGAGDGLLVLGGNGSGKSTLAWIMAGLTVPTAGTALFEGKPIAKEVGSVGLTFQHSRLQLQRRTVAEDIEAAGGPEIGTTQVSWALDAVGLDRNLAGRSIDQLSGGQMRRLVLAGLLVRQPRLLILDEPLAGLDPPGRAAIMNVLSWIRRNGTAIVVISHDVDGMDAVCSRTIHLADGILAENPVSMEEAQR
ncbi:ATP-binding cassette domain-containing protein [Rhodococcus sp. IEGM 1379]|uniref:ATP-binding cassette domain-containing protein n=1 Tax=Rhodococcus sp. IEGM 1379 TaxID=3047086 RepID=UPI0024B6DB3D|nr:ATP-binding cassette domain-containing protein [Rhodococcus sp. IEGM 1379]MDI9915338.1 ATP-binding cassette domain-containing protein [Rhodococcus sp. IEGM 1379]